MLSLSVSVERYVVADRTFQSLPLSGEIHSPTLLFVSTTLSSQSEVSIRLTKHTLLIVSFNETNPMRYEAYRDRTPDRLDYSNFSATDCPEMLSEMLSEMRRSYSFEIIQKIPIVQNFPRSTTIRERRNGAWS